MGLNEDYEDTEYDGIVDTEEDFVDQDVIDGKDGQAAKEDS